MIKFSKIYFWFSIIAAIIGGLMFASIVFGFYPADINFIDNGDGTISETGGTNLMWQQAGEQFSGTWQDAVDYCEALTLGEKSDWRLPDVQELQSIVNYGEYYPAISEPPFTNTQTINYWSSTTYFEDYPNFAWFVDFFNGYVYYDVKAQDWIYARCVRTIPETLCAIMIPTSTMPAVYEGFTYGEIVGTIFLFLIFIVVLLKLGWSLFKIKK